MQLVQYPASYPVGPLITGAISG